MCSPHSYHQYNSWTNEADGISGIICLDKLSDWLKSIAIIYLTVYLHGKKKTWFCNKACAVGDRPPRHPVFVWVKSACVLVKNPFPPAVFARFINYKILSLSIGRKTVYWVYKILKLYLYIMMVYTLKYYKLKSKTNKQKY